MKKIQLVFFIACLVFTSACSRLSARQQAFADAAVQSLWAIDAARRDDIKLKGINQLISVAKVRVNDAKENLPRGELIDSLLISMDAFEAAARDWNESLYLNSNIPEQAEKKNQKINSMNEKWDKALKILEKASTLAK